MEAFFLDLGWSWTMSKAVPYLLMVVLGIIVVLVSKRFLKRINKYLKWLFLIVILALPFGVYFMVHPIYQGDFSNNSVEHERSSDYAELVGEKLVVISIPGCKYCLEAMEDLLIMKDRVKEIEIEYVVCSTDTAAMEMYKNKGEGKIQVRLAQNAEAMMRLADFSFPTFILVDNNKPLKKWSNDSFGVFAKDEVELSSN